MKAEHFPSMQYTAISTMENDTAFRDLMQEIVDRQAASPKSPVLSTKYTVPLDVTSCEDGCTLQTLGENLPGIGLAKVQSPKN